MKTASKLDLAKGELARNEERARFVNNLPLQLLQLMARTHATANATYEVLPRGAVVGGFVARFRFFGEIDDDVYELSLMSEPWEIFALVETLDQVENEAAKAVAIRKLAAETWDTLTPEQRDALGLSSVRPGL